MFGRPKYTLTLILLMLTFPSTGYGEGGSIRINADLNLVYSAKSVESGVFLDVVILVRGIDGRQPTYQSMQMRRKLGAGGRGGGGSAGFHHIRYAADPHEIWIDGELKMSVGGTNVLMLDHADTPGGLPKLVDRTTINSYLGPVHPPGDVQRSTDQVLRLLDLLRASEAVRKFASF